MVIVIQRNASLRFLGGQEQARSRGRQSIVVSLNRLQPNSVGSGMRMGILEVLLGLYSVTDACVVIGGPINLTRSLLCNSVTDRSSVKPLILAPEPGAKRILTKKDMDSASAHLQLSRGTWVVGCTYCTSMNTGRLVGSQDGPGIILPYLISRVRQKAPQGRPSDRLACLVCLSFASFLNS